MSLSSFCVVTNALRLNLFKLRDTRHDHKRANHLKEAPEIKEETAMKKTISIEGMMCTHCEAAVKKALEAITECVKTGKGKKLNILTYRPKKGSMVRKGHRQPYTKVEITAING